MLPDCGVSYQGPMPRGWLFALAGGLLVLAARSAIAQNEAPPELPRGFARASVGVGELWIHDPSYAQWGRIIPLEVAGGVAVAPRLALFGAFYGTRIVAPISDEYRLSSVTLYGMGPGVQWQLEQPNVFIAGSVSVSRLHIDRADTQPDGTSHWGILGRLSLGTQWRAAPHWWLGLAGELTLGRMASIDTQSDFGRGATAAAAPTRSGPR